MPAGVVVDATLGGGGHAEALLDAHPHLSILGLDQDPDAIDAATARLARFGDRVTVRRTRFDEIARVVADVLPGSGPEGASGALFDLGVSSPQLDRPERGFSYRGAGPLDMRMDPSRPRERRRPGQRVGRGRAGAAAAGLRRRAPRGPHRPGHRRPAADRHHRRAGRDRARRGARPGPPARRPSGPPHVPGDPHRRQRRARHPARHARRRPRGARARRALRGHRLPLGRGPHRQGPLPARRHRRLDRARRTCPRPPTSGPEVVLLRRGAWRPTDAEITENPRAEAARLRAVEKLDLQEVA